MASRKTGYNIESYVPEIPERFLQEVLLKFLQRFSPELLHEFHLKLCWAFLHRFSREIPAKIPPVKSLYKFLLKNRFMDFSRDFYWLFQKFIHGLPGISPEKISTGFFSEIRLGISLGKYVQGFLQRLFQISLQEFIQGLLQKNLYLVCSGNCSRDEQVDNQLYTSMKYAFCLHCFHYWKNSRW